MTERIVVVGADAAGMSAVSQALRIAEKTGRELAVTVLDRGHWTSYSACGIPYWVAGDVDGPDALIARTAEEHRERGIDVRLGHEVAAVDLEARAVDVVVESGRDGGERGDRVRIPFDQLVLATGADPIRPDLPGIEGEGIFGIQTLDDGAAVLDYLGRRSPRRATVVGAGYIGLEMAEAMVRRGTEVTVVDGAEEPMTTIDPDLGRQVRKAMTDMGIDVRTSTAVEGFEIGDDGHVRRVRTAAGAFDTDVVVLGIGTRPATTLARAAGLPLGQSGGLKVDERLRVSGHEGIWAAGDCVESYDRVRRGPVHVALGTHANKQGRVLGTNLGGGSASFPGIVGTAVSKICDLEIARTGLSTAAAEQLGLDAVSATIDSTTRAGYFPGAEAMTVKVIAERGTARLLGAQIVGRDYAAKRIDTLAMALWNEMSAADVAMTDLSYAPPFSPVWDPVQIAARKAAEAATR